MALKDVEKEQKEFETDIGQIKTGNPRRKLPEQTQAIRNIENLYKSRKEVLKLFNDYGRNMSDNVYKSKHGKELKIPTLKQMLQRLPIALTQIKAGNNSESLLNKIR